MAVKLYVGCSTIRQYSSDLVSNVTVSVSCSWTGGSWNHLKPSGWVKIDGYTYNFKSSFNKNKSKSGSCTLYSKNVNVQHASDGSKILPISAQFNTGVSSGNITASANVKLTTITGGNQTSTTATKQSNQVTIDKFGIQSETDRTMYITWSWSKSNTDHYQVIWYYDTGDSVWFIGSDSTTKDTQSLYTAPENADKIKVKIKPVSETRTVNNSTTSYWSADWSSEKIYDFADSPPKIPAVPSIDIDEDLNFTTELDNLDVNATGIQFQIVKNNSSVFKTGDATIITNHASYSCVVDPGCEYKVRCRSYRDNNYSDWSEYSANVETVPSVPSGITNIKANSETSVYLEWTEVSKAESYSLEYATKKEYFDGSNNTTTVTGIEFSHYELTGLETGYEYFFRVCAVNQNGSSDWSEIKSVRVGTDPSAPTTWSSTTTVIVGEPLNLYWVHNSEDGSTQTYAELELNIDGVVKTHTIKNSTDEEDKDKTSIYTIDTTQYSEGVNIKWRVRTAGVTLNYGDWSIQRVVDVYAKPTLEFGLTDIEGELIDSATSFPFYASALAGPNTQMPIGYHVTVSSNEIYETIDSIGKNIMVNEGQEVYSKYFDTNDPLVVEFSANNIDLENNMRYTISCSAFMNSGLTVSSSLEFKVSWTEKMYIPNAEISINRETLTASIRPYCEVMPITYYKVDYDSTNYIKTEEELEKIEGIIVEDAQTETGEDVYLGMLSNPDIYYCETMEPVTFYYNVEYNENISAYEVSSEISETDGLPLGETYTITGEEVCYGISELGETFNFCMIEGSKSTYFKVTVSNSGVYTKTNEEVSGMVGEIVDGALTTTEEEVYIGKASEGTSVYFCIVTGDAVLTDDVVLAVYRREFDGDFVELGKNINNASNTYITDPHPSLDYARYRVVATTKSTGAVSFYDVPGYPVGGKAVIIQWDEDWVNFDTSNADALEQPPWSGSMVQLPYNIDISDDHATDVDLVKYIGRKRPVAYYGTQLGESATWNVEIPKNDIEALYAIRRLSIWMGNVYIREPSGSGYWANVSVSYSQKHCELTIPISFKVTRVEGDA